MNRPRLEVRLRSDAVASVPFGTNTEQIVEGTVRRLQEYLAEVSDLIMPRRGRPSPRRSVFWWTESIAGLRRICVSSLRSYQRAGRRGVPRDHLYERYSAARTELRLEIKKEKEEA